MIRFDPVRLFAGEAIEMLNAKRARCRLERRRSPKNFRKRATIVRAISAMISQRAMALEVYAAPYLSTCSTWTRLGFCDTSACQKYPCIIGEKGAQLKEMGR
ncbi:MAG: hypothetical protein QOJ42_4518, partial [Acidobacteriaceae bacterium]|nr:hypothetical protein [Acidobacteriaceae bacterium]